MTPDRFDAMAEALMADFHNWMLPDAAGRDRNALAAALRTMWDEAIDVIAQRAEERARLGRSQDRRFKVAMEIADMVRALKSTPPPADEVKP